METVIFTSWKTENEERRDKINYLNLQPKSDKVDLMIYLRHSFQFLLVLNMFKMQANTEVQLKLLN